MSEAVRSSVIAGFRHMSPQTRLAEVAAATGLSASDMAALSGCDVLPLELADGMIENVIGKFEIPLGVATNFVVNGREYLIPMAVEEPSVVAAASYMAKIGFRGHSGGRSMLIHLHS